MSFSVALLLYFVAPVAGAVLASLVESGGNLLRSPHANNDRCRLCDELSAACPSCWWKWYAPGFEVVAHSALLLHLLPWGIPP